MGLNSRKPNILLILTDQHAPKVAGFAGDPVVQTPHLDELASRSVQFDTAICASPVCTPSRMCMLTGKEAHTCSAWNNHWVIFPEHLTWPAHFASHGYLNMPGRKDAFWRKGPDAGVSAPTLWGSQARPGTSGRPNRFFPLLCWSRGGRHHGDPREPPAGCGSHPGVPILSPRTSGPGA